jgi:ABC-type xylose transport system permease subunit
MAPRPTASTAQYLVKGLVRLAAIYVDVYRKNNG